MRADDEVRNAQYSGREEKGPTRVRRIRGQIDALERSLEGEPNAVPYSNRSLPFGARLTGYGRSA